MTGGRWWSLGLEVGFCAVGNSMAVYRLAVSEKSTRQIIVGLRIFVELC